MQQLSLSTSSCEPRRLLTTNLSYGNLSAAFRQAACQKHYCNNVNLANDIYYDIKFESRSAAPIKRSVHARAEDTSSAKRVRSRLKRSAVNRVMPLTLSGALSPRFVRFRRLSENQRRPKVEATLPVPRLSLRVFAGPRRDIRFKRLAAEQSESKMGGRPAISRDATRAATSDNLRAIVLADR